MCNQDCPFDQLQIPVPGIDPIDESGALVVLEFRRFLARTVPGEIDPISPVTVSMESFAGLVPFIRRSSQPMQQDHRRTVPLRSSE
jgi:hypothetical protein